jgi:hypothetical protein
MVDLKGLDATIFSSRNVLANAVKIHYVIGGQGRLSFFGMGSLPRGLAGEKLCLP